MNYELIKLDTTGEIAHLTLNQPATRNGLTAALCDEIIAAVGEIGRRDDIRALILAGAGPSFCAGANLGDIFQASAEEGSVGQRGARMMELKYNAVILGLQQLRVPIVSAVQGAVAGAGISLALSADIVIAARSAFFLSPFLPRLGIVPDMGASWFLPQHIGRARTLGMILLGDRLPAEQALAWGLIWACVDDDALASEALAIAARLARAPAHSALEARHALDAAACQSLAGQLDYEKERQRDLLDRPSFKEGVQAFFEKREPVFKP